MKPRQTTTNAYLYVQVVFVLYIKSCFSTLLACTPCNVMATSSGRPSKASQSPWYLNIAASQGRQACSKRGLFCAALTCASHQP
jgi:hypothetical protein